MRTRSRIPTGLGRRMLSGVFAAAASAVLLFPAAAAGLRRSAGADVWQAGEGFTFDETAGTYSTASTGTATVGYTGDISDKDTVEMVMNYRDGTDGVSHMGISLGCGETAYNFILCTNPASGGPLVAFVLKNGFDGIQRRVDMRETFPGQYDGDGRGQDIRLKVVFYEGHVRFTVDDNEVYAASDSFGEDRFDSVKVVSYATTGTVSGLNVSRSRAADGMWNVPSTGWHVNTADGETVYTRDATDGTELSSKAVYSPDTANALTFDLRVDKAAWSDAQANFEYRLPGGGKYTFQIFSDEKKARIAENGQTVAETAFDCGSGWQRYRAVFDKALLALYTVDGSGKAVLLCSAAPTGQVFSDGRLYVYGRNIVFGVKNTAAEKVDFGSDDEMWNVPSTGWHVNTADGETVYTRDATDGTELSSKAVYSPDTANALTFDLRVDKAAWSDAQANFEYRLPGGGKYTFQIFSDEKKARIAENGQTVAETAFDCGSGWQRYRAVFDKALLALYTVDGSGKAVLLCSAAPTGQDFSDGRLYVYGRNIVFGVKNTAVEKVDADEPADGEQWSVPTSGWETTEEDGRKVYTRNATENTEMALKRPLRAADGKNAMIFDLRLNRTMWTTAPMRVAYRLPNGDAYRFTIDAGEKSAGIDENGTSVGGIGHESPLGEWRRIKIVFDERFLAIYLLSGNDETLLCCGYPEEGKSFDGGRLYIYGTNIHFSVRDIELTHADVSGAYDRYVDFRFRTARSVAAFKAEQAQLRFDDALVMELTGEGARLISPTIAAMRGTAYSALLDVRNTLVVRLTNGTAATAMRVSFITDRDGTYDERKSVIFPVEPYADARTVYFNLSQSAGATGYLRGFAIEPIGAAEGTVRIDGIRFEREMPYYAYAGEVTSCLAADGSVTVAGRVDKAYRGRTVKIWQSEVENQFEELDYVKARNNVPLAEAEVQTDGSFTARFALKNGDLTHLSSFFLAETDGVKIAPQFRVENWDDYADDPYAFTLPDRVVRVTDRGAKGDGFTNDTDAIQAAIDEVSAAGGGTVLVPGTDEAYGVRYVITHLRLKDDVELRLEHGAVLWQSPDAEEYDYPVYLGHHNMGDKYIAWGSSALMNYPLLFLNGVKNVKITGGGTVRMADIGTECADSDGITKDGVYGNGADPFQIGCEQTIHMVPIAIYGCENVEIRDLSVRRANFWHFYIREASRLFFGNVDLGEVNCINGDGFDFSSAVHDVVMDRCAVYTNDDALGICVATNDPRDDVSTWRSKGTKPERSMDHFVIRNGCYSGGHGLTFIPWASDYADQSMAEIRDITLEDTILNGNWSSVGGWWDNPFFGDSNYFDGTYDNNDAESDHSPIRDVTLKNVICKSGFYFNGWQNITNFVNDLGLDSSAAFENATFDKVVRYPVQKDHVTGLSYWSGDGDIGTAETDPQRGYSAFIRGSGSLWQGLTLTAGTYRFRLLVKNVAEGAMLFAEDAASGQLLGEMPIDSADTLTQRELVFGARSKGLYRIGIRNTADGETVWLDEAELERTGSYDPAFAHQHKMEWIEKAATCTAAGRTGHYRCSRCGKGYADAAGKELLKDADTLIPSMGHDYRWVVDREPTAAEEGRKHEECSRCGRQRSVASIPKIGGSGGAGDPADPVDPALPVAPVPSGDPDASKPDEPRSDRSDDAPKTGATSTGAGAAAMAVLLCGAAAAMCRRRGRADEDSE